MTASMDEFGRTTRVQCMNSLQADEYKGDPMMDDPTIETMTDAQRDKILRLGGNPDEFHPAFDLPAGYVAGWAKGVYYGVDRNGVASS